MSRVRNAAEFLEEYRQLRRRYDGLFSPLVDAIRESYTDSPAGSVPPSVDDALEAHVREYFVNAFLRALNWRMDVTVEDGIPNLLPEAPVYSSTTGTIKFLDYLGTEADAVDPLIIIETKRPRSALPKRKDLAGKTDIDPVAEEPLPSVIAAGLGGAGLSGEWNKWLETLRVYVRSVYEQRERAPRRVVLTSGRWLVIFTDPVDSFLSGGTPDPNKILVFTVEDGEGESKDLIAENYGIIFRWLEHQFVLDEVPPLNVGEIGFHVRPEHVERVMHGLRLLYIEEPGFLSPSPVIKVMPVILFRSSFGAWLRVESGIEIPMPYSQDLIEDHLNHVHEVGTGLLRELNTRLGLALTANTIESHYTNTDDFRYLRGVVEKLKSTHHDEHIIVTGQHTHYYRLEPTVPNCPHHNWGNSNREGRAALVAIQSRSTKPRAFFVSGENHYCAHRHVDDAKSSPITPLNKDRCGARSGNEYDPFCEIWRFEKYLCCRTCVFENVCTRAPVFSLPCHHQPG